MSESRLTEHQTMHNAQGGNWLMEKVLKAKDNSHREAYAQMNTEQASKEFLKALQIISVETGYTTVEVFWRFIDWAFWMTVAETRQLAEKLGIPSVVPYSIDECKTNWENAREFLVGKDCAKLFGAMSKIWTTRGLSQEDFLLDGVTRYGKKMDALMAKELGQYFTPSSVGKLMAELINAGEQNEDVIVQYEPCVGFGGLVLQSWFDYGGLDKPLGSRVYVCEELAFRTMKACYLQLTVNMVPAQVKNTNSLSREQFRAPFYTGMWLMALVQNPMACVQMTKYMKN